MRICYLNHDLRNDTGAGRFGLSFLTAIKEMAPSAESIVLTTEGGQMPILSPSKLKLLLALPKIRNIFKKCDIIHALDAWPYGVIAAIANVGLGKKLIITAIGTGAVQPLYNFWKKPLLVWAYRHATKVVAVSNNTKREILKVISNLKIDVVNHGVDYKKYQVAAIKHQESEKFKPYILSVGALKKRKGYDFSIRAFAEISKEFPDLKYVIVGKGQEYDNLQFLISDLQSRSPEGLFQLKDKIIFLESLSEGDLISLYKNAELFILLPRDINKDIEGFGLVFLEAAAAGLPIVAFRGTAAEDAVVDGKNGFLVGAEDVQGAAAAMVKILIAPQLRSNYSNESVRFAQSMTWTKAASSYQGIYQSLYS